MHLPSSLAVMAILAAGAPAKADTLFFDDFSDGHLGWSESGNVRDLSSATITPKPVRLRKVGMIWRTVPTDDHEDVTLTWTMAARALEGADRCLVEVNDTSGWRVVAVLENGHDDAVFRSGTVDLGPGAADNPDLQIRYRDNSNALGDYCYVGGTGVSGVPILAQDSDNDPAPDPAPDPSDVTPGDPLKGDGESDRTVLTAEELLIGSRPDGPVDDGAFALPPRAAHPDHAFEGRLELHDEADRGGFDKIVDRYNYDNDPERLHLPEFDFEFVQEGSHLLPVRRELIRRNHAYWEYILLPGRAWTENGDGGLTRAALPFALVERNANCTHNGVMTFLFDDAIISDVRYQITQETCEYFKADYWGQLEATYHRGPVESAAAVRAARRQELIDAVPVKPLQALSADYPGTDVTTFGRGISPEHMTWQGLYIDGTNYVSGCRTRRGFYAFCSQMLVPSYSLAKSMFASIALMRLSAQYGRFVPNLFIIDHVSEANGATGVWNDVTFNHTIDMATGNYRFSSYMRDEGGPILEDFFLSETRDERLDNALRFPRKAAPGSRWVYHTSDAYVLVDAMQAFLATRDVDDPDIFNYLVREVLVPIRIGPSTKSSLRTYETDGSRGQPFGGYGMFLTQDAVAKIGRLLNNDGGAAADGEQLLEPDQLAATLQHDPSDRGLPTSGGTDFMYNNGFWAAEHTRGYPCTFWTPFMSGFGGMTVVLMPNGTTYYYFSDNDEFSWFDAVEESHEMRSHCE